MNKQTVSTLFGGERRAQILQLFYSHPWEKFHQREVERRLEAPFGALHRLLRLFVSAGLLTSTKEANLVVYRAATTDKRLKPLVDLLRQDTELVEQLRRAVKPLQVAYAGIFGSYARGEETADSDVDVLVLWPDDELEDRAAANAAVTKVGFKLSRDINIDGYTLSEFRALLTEANSFAVDVLMQPRIDLKGDMSKAEAKRQRRGRPKLPQTGTNPLGGHQASGQPA
jgi:hypothetical protein